MTVIKRYDNRKLYDSVLKRYVTALEVVVRMIDTDELLRIEDHKTGKDLTRQVVQTWFGSDEALLESPEFLCELVKRVAA